MKVNSQPIHQEAEMPDQLKHLIKKRPLLGKLRFQLGLSCGVSGVCVGEKQRVSGTTCCQLTETK
jgi:hypothetical protein